MANIITSRKSRTIDCDRLARGLSKRDRRGRPTYSGLGESVAQADRERRECIESARKRNKANNGFTQERHFRHVARIPVEAGTYYRQKADIRDQKTLKKWIKGQGFNVVRPGSF